MRPQLSAERFDAVLFDLDGVLTDTAAVHARAWKTMFDEFLRDWAERHGQPFTPFSIDRDYKTYVDGKPRYDGVRAFLASRHIVLPDGDPGDEPGDDTVCAMGNRKNVLFNDILEREGIAPYPGSLRTLDVLDRLGVRSAIVSSSKNARSVLDASGLAARFEVVVDGSVVAERGLRGKPAPDAYLLGAEQLGVDPARSVVVEDAVSGVAAGVAGAFAVVIGIDRGAGPAALLAHGATFVADDLADLIESETTA